MFDDEFDDFDESMLESIYQASQPVAPQAGGSAAAVLAPSAPNVIKLAIAKQPPPSTTRKPVGGAADLDSLLPALRATLKKRFGHADFRDGQGGVCEAAVRGLDSAVFWATGASLRFQNPRPFEMNF